MTCEWVSRHHRSAPRFAALPPAAREGRESKGKERKRPKSGLCHPSCSFCFSCSGQKSRSFPTGVKNKFWKLFRPSLGRLAARRAPKLDGELIEGFLRPFSVRPVRGVISGMCPDPRVCICFSLWVWIGLPRLLSYFSVWERFAAGIVLFLRFFRRVKKTNKMSKKQGNENGNKTGHSSPMILHGEDNVRAASSFVYCHVSIAFVTAFSEANEFSKGAMTRQLLKASSFSTNAFGGPGGDWSGPGLSSPLGGLVGGKDHPLTSVRSAESESTSSTSGVTVPTTEASPEEGGEKGFNNISRHLGLHSQERFGRALIALLRIGNRRLLFRNPLSKNVQFSFAICQSFLWRFQHLVS